MTMTDLWVWVDGEPVHRQVSHVDAFECLQTAPEYHDLTKTGLLEKQSRKKTGPGRPTKKTTDNAS